MSVTTMSNRSPFIDNHDDFLDYALAQGFSDLHFKTDSATGMKAIIAIHNTKLGPALGGCRFIEYPSTNDAILDAMRLAKGMSYKSAAVGLPLGGGKSVIIKPAGSFDRPGYMRAFGRFINELNGRYITALDSGTTLDDMDIMHNETPYVASLSKYNGEPSPYTARGVLVGLQAAVASKLGRDDLKGIHVAIQGLGHVGYKLAKHLHELGAKLTVTDVSKETLDQACKEFNAEKVEANKIHTVKCDVFAPCALGAVLNDTTVHQLQTSIVAGAANNQLSHPGIGKILHDKGILYCADYIINAGGLIFAAAQYLHTPQSTVSTHIDNIRDTLSKIFARSIQENTPASIIADRLAEERLA